MSDLVLKFYWLIAILLSSNSKTMAPRLWFVSRQWGFINLFTDLLA